ncbi:hypothetical protein NEOLEDRAFT_1137233 [Neolentinus lepideus HHB14362 ss-1]|uniref:Sacsin/Nov domain-containing protein n=1 Tax=Neolentinus lepideus HHB14362 ss-1 TaxID=1314782 RepID=A0A165QUL2_9AGAM|nr:hypothetical protein NEOLEDRAFT_1137233 [Neolentinus lepideus HHB14362 ss-1]
MANLRDALWESGRDESVEVNQRALIDKVLARYSGEFTVFRELLQNSDDAGSSAVEIHFETKLYLERKPNDGEYQDGAGVAAVSSGKQDLPDLKTVQVHQWVFKNNGQVFREEDWSRLKKIAEGNPDEEKIGAFGVGFYSLFSVTEDPFVTSGDQWMGFYWKGDQLLARRGNTSKEPDPWTSFLMVLREPSPLPPAFDFTRFLASSITFMAHLREVSVFLDDKCLARLLKTPGHPKALSIPRGLKNTSPGGGMAVKGIQVTPLHIKAEVLRWVYSVGTEKPPPVVVPPKPRQAPASGGFFSSLFSSFASTPSRTSTPIPPPPSKPQSQVNLLEVNESNVTLSIFTADVEVRLDKKVEKELYRSTKKNPPSRLKYELIYTGKDEYDESKKEDDKYPYTTGSIFQGLRADLDGSGSARVFIGHATGQTTGIGGHMAARFIPTVERESIDLMDRNVAIWNKELLYVGGFLSRAAYSIELANIQEVWNGLSSDAASNEIKVHLPSRGLHVLKFFTFHPSTPSSTVSQLLQEAFFSCGTSQGFPMISTAGIRDVGEVRVPDEAFAGFLKNLPVVPAEILAEAKLMIDVLQARRMLKDITFDDVLKELRLRPLSEAETIACLKWWITVHRSGQGHARVRTELLNAAVMSIGASGDSDEKIIQLSAIETFLNPKQTGAVIPTDGPLPEHLLPLRVSKALELDTLVVTFGWRELTVIDWLKYIADVGLREKDVEYDLARSAVWAERVLSGISRQWSSFSQPMQTEIVGLLKDITCVPTTAGLKCPGQAYFSNVNLFRDLPTVAFPSATPVKGPLERLFTALGVRKHVELQIVFDRMIKTGDWTIADLTKYLVSVQSTLTNDEVGRLRNTSAFPREAYPGEDSGKNKLVRYKASDLYEPLDIFRELKLPVLDWGGHVKWRGSSEEAKFLYRLGLLKFPPMEVIINLAASPDTGVRKAAMKYFLDNFAARYSDYIPDRFADKAFIPTRDGNLAKPGEVFVNSDWEKLDYRIVDDNIRNDALTKLKIHEHPHPSALVSLLQRKSPRTEAVASEWFAVLASRISAFTPTQLKTLSQMPIVPTRSNGAEKSDIRMLPPCQCYFAGDSDGQVHSKLFVYVNFGPQANSFLMACGAKNKPSVNEIAQMMLGDPRRFYNEVGGRPNFLTELRNLAANRRSIVPATFTRMKRSPILLGSRRVKKAALKTQDAALNPDIDEEDWEYEYDLRRPEQIVVADEINSYRLFGDSVFTAPQEDLLEEFYIDLGCPRLSRLVREDYKTSNEIRGAKIAVETRTRVLERLPLFLHEHRHETLRFTFNWLNSGNNFVVKTFGKLIVTKSLKYETRFLSQEREASAAAKRDGNGPIQLWLAGNTQVDMYEVATSLCHLIFQTPRNNDALLFMTILSTDLKSLKRRGYNVDRILRQQQAEREAAYNAAREKMAAETTLVSDVSPALPGSLLPPPSQVRNAPERPEITTETAASLGSTPNSSVEDVPREHQSQAKTPSTAGNALQNLMRRFNHPQSTSSSEGLPAFNPGLTTSSAVTPLSNIVSNIETAVKACREEKSDLLNNRKQMQTVKETLDEGYCDVSGYSRDLHKAGDMGDIPVFVSPDVLDRYRNQADAKRNDPKRGFMEDKHDALARFIYVIQELRDVYQLPAKSLHIFCDLGGELIAFNREGSLYLNLRYYEAWHDEEVRRGDRSKAYISWYFTLAHEVAHNLVQPHNSEHEFYFSAICEQYLVPFSRLLS